MAELLRRLRTRRNDDGFTLVMSVMLTAVVFTLGATWVVYANHESSSSSYDRRRQQAIDAANAGWVVADAALSRSSTYTGVAVTAFASGSAEYEVTVVDPPDDGLPFRRVITSVGYAPSKTAIDRVTRTVRQVVDLDPIGFQYAMFSESTILTGSSSTVIGDIFSITNITLGNSQDYIGNIYSLGTVTTGSNQGITGNIYANGSVSLGSTSTSLYGSVYSGGSITVKGTVRDTAQAGSTVSDCGRVFGDCIEHEAPPAVPNQQLPTYVFNESAYKGDGLTVTYHTDGAAFVASNSKVNMNGVHKVTGNVLFSKNDTLWLTGDTVIVASGNIRLPGNVENHAAGGASVQLTIVSSPGLGWIEPSNNFTIPTTVKTLIFTEGMFKAKNSSTFSGALYAGSLSAGAHIAVTYATLDDTGFDWTSANPQSFTIRNISTREIVNGT